MLGTNISTSKSRPYASGHYYPPDGIGFQAAGGAFAAGTIAMTPGTVSRTVTIASLAVRLTTASAATNVQISLYQGDAVTGYPTGAPLFTSTSQATTATGVIEVACSLTLNPGTIYWLAIQRDNATTVFMGVNPGSNDIARLIGATASSLLMQTASTMDGLAKAGTFGTWPTFTGNITTDSLTEQSGSAPPSWAFKAA